MGMKGGRCRSLTGRPHPARPESLTGRPISRQTGPNPSAVPMPRVLVVDNYDCFTWNLVHLIGPLGARRSRCVRNDETDRARRSSRDGAGRDRPVARSLHARTRPASASTSSATPAERIPILGVCLGHQAIGQAFGGEVVRAPRADARQGLDDPHDGRGVFRGINGPIPGDALPLARRRRATPARPSSRSTAETDDGLIMGAVAPDLPVHGVQFHPESIASEHGAHDRAQLPRPRRGVEPRSGADPFRPRRALNRHGRPSSPTSPRSRPAPR